MDFPTLLLLTVTVANVGLGVLVFLRNTRSLKYRYYLGLALSVGLWTSTNAVFRLIPPDQLLPVALLSYVGAIMTATFFLLFNREFSGYRIIPDSPIIAVGAIFAVLSLKPGIIATSVTGSREINTTFGIYALALVLATFFVWGLVLLVMFARKSRAALRNQARLMLLGMSVAIIMGVLFNLVLPIEHVYSYVYLGPSFTLVYLGVIAYAIFRHRLFDIRVIVARSVTYALLLITVATSYTLVAFRLGTLLFGSDTGTLREAYNVVLALVLAFTFQPLRRFFERITERFFYRDRYDSQAVLNNFTGILVSELDLDRILKKALETLCESLHIQFGQIIVFNNDRVYRIEHFGPLPKRLMVAPELRRLNRAMLIADELESGERKTLLEGHGVRVSMMLSTREEFVGFILLGDKLSGDIYSNQDIELLEIIRKELAVAILNAKSYAEIQAFNITLQARVDHATNRLRVANRHLKELDKAKDEFISMASHQLRTPLTTIKGYLSMMLEGDAGPISSGQKEFAQFAFDSSERMVNLISDLLNISRLNAGRFLIQRTPTDMVQMIEDEVRQATQHADGKGIKLVFDRPDHPLPPVEIDENKTRQVVMNFIDNAIYYTQKGEVRVVLKQTGDMVHLEVHDTGIGVPEAARRKLFTKFYRAENAQTVRPDGTGLGLYLAKRVIQDQDGTIIFNSVEGKGSTFGFELPFKPKPVKHEDKKHAKSH